MFRRLAAMRRLLSIALWRLCYTIGIIRARKRVIERHQSIMDRNEIDAQKIIVNTFEEDIAKTIKQLIPLGNNAFIILTAQRYPNNLYLAEYFSETDKPSLLRGEKKGPALIVKELINIEAHKDIRLGGVDQNDWKLN